MIGEGDDKNYMSDFIDKHRLNAITLAPKENIFDYYNIVDIVVLPSRVEPFGIVAIEAGLIKKAFIGSNVDGLKEIITDGTDGILFEKENVESLAQNLKKLIDNRDLRTILGEALHQKVIKNFTSGKIVQRYEKIYNQILTK
jgi:glycosyltransferase involved in cell wall biosynthesis